MEAKHTFKALSSENSRVIDGSRLLAAVWSEETNDARKPDESWLEMRDRTQAERAAKEAQQFAYAKLFSAAPDMLKALQDLKPILDSAESNASGTANWEYVRDAVLAAREAIKKATEES